MWHGSVEEEEVEDGGEVGARIAYNPETFKPRWSVKKMIITTGCFE